MPHPRQSKSNANNGENDATTTLLEWAGMFASSGVEMLAWKLDLLSTSMLWSVYGGGSKVHHRFAVEWDIYRHGWRAAS